MTSKTSDKVCCDAQMRATTVLDELTTHLQECDFCWSISEASESHRLARLELLH